MKGLGLGRDQRRRKEGQVAALSTNGGVDGTADDETIGGVDCGRRRGGWVGSSAMNRYVEANVTDGSRGTGQM